MRVIQTFWSGNKDPLIDSFGWRSPQYHLMSWALSCLSLKENYREVILYTDSVGYNLFKNLLKLPYDDIVVQYDKLSCPEDHWAYPKLLTYSLQEKPFMHVDGDVYLPQRLNNKIEAGEIIAQNREIGSDYYRNMMDMLLQNDIIIPDFLKKELEKDSIPSYNAGVIGGNNLTFIQKYCQQAFDFIKKNQLNDPTNKNANVNYNILFEQILFYALTQTLNKTVTTVIDHSIRDNRYTYDEFCDFYNYGKQNLMHIIGGHKRNTRICELLSRTLLSKYPEYYKRIIKLFPEQNRRLTSKKERSLDVPVLTTQMNIASYQDFLKNLSIEWADIQNDDLLNLEKRTCNYFDFLNYSKKNRSPIIIKNNPYLSIYEITNDWTLDARQIIKERIDKDYASPHFDIACVPHLLNKGLNEVLIDDLAYNIITLLKEEKSFKSLFDGLLRCFHSKIKKDRSLIYKQVITKLEYLFYNKLIYIDII